MLGSKTPDLIKTGERLRIAREGIGLSLRSMAERLRSAGVPVSHSMLANYERGMTHPPDSVPAEYARICNRPIEWFHGSGLVLEGIRYRALKSVTVRQKARYTHDAQQLLTLYLYLEALLNQPLKASLQCSAIDRSVSGEMLSSEVREKCGLGIHPLPSVPRLLEDFGVRVIQLLCEARIDAFAARFAGSRVVVLSAGLSPDRMRLTGLHELAHHLYEDCLTGAALSHNEIEKRAFEFASHLLMPACVLEEAFHFKSMVRLVEYKERYGISLAAMIFRAKRNRLISQRLYKRLWQQFSKLGFRRDEPGHVVPDSPIRMEALLDAAVTKRTSTYQEIAARLGIDETILRNRVLAAMGGSPSQNDPGPESSLIDFRAYKEGLDLI